MNLLLKFIFVIIGYQIFISETNCTEQFFNQEIKPHCSENLPQLQNPITEFQSLKIEELCTMGPFFPIIVEHLGIKFSVGKLSVVNKLFHKKVAENFKPALIKEELKKVKENEKKLYAHKEIIHSLVSEEDGREEECLFGLQRKEGENLETEIDQITSLWEFPMWEHKYYYPPAVYKKLRQIYISSFANQSIVKLLLKTEKFLRKSTKYENIIPEYSKRKRIFLNGFIFNGIKINLIQQLTILKEKFKENSSSSQEINDEIETKNDLLKKVTEIDKFYLYGRPEEIKKNYKSLLIGRWLNGYLQPQGPSKRRFYGRRDPIEWFAHTVSINNPGDCKRAIEQNEEEC